MIKSVKSVYKKTENFTMKVNVHQKSAFSPYLFALVMDKLTKSVQDEPP